MDVGVLSLHSATEPPVRAGRPLVGRWQFRTSQVDDPSSMKRAKGFSLIELMIAVAVVGILAVIAIPSYEYAVRKGNRGDAQAFMLEVAQREQQIFVDSRAFVAVAGNGSFPGAVNLTVPTHVARFYDFSVALSVGPPPTYTITATPKGKQTPDGALTMDNLGNKTPTDKW